MAKIIGLNCLFLIPNQVGGTEYHTRSYIQSLQEIDTENNYKIFCNKENFSTIELFNPRWEKVLCPIHASQKGVRLLYEQLILPFLVSRLQCDILHSFGYFGPIFTHSKRVITLHDVNWRDCPEDFGFLESLALRLLIETNIHTAHTIISTSEFSKKRFEKHFPRYKNKNALILSGVEEDFLEELKKAKPPKTEQYFLSVSAFYPHKNVLELLNVWEEYAAHHINTKLVLIGKNGKDEKAVLRKIQQLPSVKHYPKVPFAQLVSLYKYAQGFLFASTYEGFGHPVYEALAAGIPVHVKRKELFEKKLQPYLADLIALDKLRSTPQKVSKSMLPRYIDSSRKLISLYKNAVSDKSGFV